MSGGLTVFEHTKLLDARDGEAPHAVPPDVFAWLESLCLRDDDPAAAWLRMGRSGRRRAVQVLNHVGVLRAPSGFQIEVLPKIGTHLDEGKARDLLIEMLRCLPGFRHVETATAHLLTARMPLLEVFIRQFLEAVQQVVKRGLRSDYVLVQDDLPAMRGKLVFATHLRRNLVRRDRFFTEHSLYDANRPENRLLKASLQRVLTLTRAQAHQRLARELLFVFDEVPAPLDVAEDFRRVRLDRGMRCYEPALAWARLILEDRSPVTGHGKSAAMSLLFPMELLFEAFVEHHLRRQLAAGLVLKAQASSKHLVTHRGQAWFRLKPDLVVYDGGAAVPRNRFVLDTKWKLLDASKDSPKEKYGLDHQDFYQLHAYGHHYLDGEGDLALVYPRTEAFPAPLPVFAFAPDGAMRQWALPFCLESRRLLVPEGATSLAAGFNAPSALG